MRDALLALLFTSAHCGGAHAGPVTDRWTAEATDKRGGQELRTLVTFTYSGKETDNGRAQWDVSVRCEAKDTATGNVTTITGQGGAMLAQGSFAGTAGKLGYVDVLEPENDFRGGKPGPGNLSVDDRRCASGVPVIKRSLVEKPASNSVLEGRPVAKASMTVDLTGRPWRHNGSIVMADPGGTGIIAYLEPKSSLRPSVAVGTVLFRGALHPDRPVVGTAYAYKNGCPAAPYPVRGIYSGSDSLTLRGAGPVRHGCEVVAYSDRSPHSVLKFTYLLED